MNFIADSIGDAGVSSSASSANRNVSSRQRTCFNKREKTVLMEIVRKTFI